MLRTHEVKVSHSCTPAAHGQLSTRQLCFAVRLDCLLMFWMCRSAVPVAGVGEASPSPMAIASPSLRQWQHGVMSPLPAVRCHPSGHPCSDQVKGPCWWQKASRKGGHRVCQRWSQEGSSCGILWLSESQQLRSSPSTPPAPLGRSRACPLSGCGGLCLSRGLRHDIRVSAPCFLRILFTSSH